MQHRVVSTVKFQWMLCLLVSLWLSLWSTTPLFAQATDETGRIAGIVTNEEGVPLEGVTVDLIAIDAAVSDGWLAITDGTTTDATGAYLLVNVPPGHYTVRFRDGLSGGYRRHYYGYYGFQFYGNQTNRRDAQYFAVNAGQTVSGISIKLALGSTITGNIRFHDGRIPVLPTNENFQVGLPLYYQDGDDWLRLGAPVDLTTSSEQSVFQIGGLVPGRYRLGYWISYHIFDHNLLRFNTYEGYYDRSLDFLSATPIQIAANGVVSPINLMIDNSRDAALLSGNVATPAAKPLSGIHVTAYQIPPGGTLSAVRSAVTDVDGNYTLRELNAGDYLVYFQDPQGRYPAQFADQSTAGITKLYPVAPGEHMQGIDAILQPGATLAGNLSTCDGPLPADFDLSTWFRLEAFVQSAIGDQLIKLAPNPYNEATGVNVNRLAGDRYALATELAPGRYQIYSSNCDENIENDWITLTITSATTIDLDLVVDAGSAQLRGQVRNEQDEPLAGVQVTLLSGEAELYGEQGTTDGDGYYHFPVVNPGSYRLLFHDPAGEYGFAYFPNAPDPLTAAYVTVGPGTIADNLDIRLAPAGRIAGTITLHSSGHFADGEQPYLQLMYIMRQNISTPLMLPKIESHIRERAPGSNVWTGEYTVSGLATGAYAICFYGILGDDHVPPYIGKCYGSIYNEDTTDDIHVTAGATTTLDVVFANDNQRVLALYALALDHDPDRIDNLAPQLAPAMQSIIAATRDQPNKTAVVLADAAGVGDTRIYVVQNGRATPVQGLPNAAFQLDQTLTEANMADGATLGNFIRWARNTYPAEVTLFGFVGHGAPLVPASGFADIVAASGGIRPFGPTDLSTNLFPLPSRVDAYPSLTDNHPEALITPHDLATALRIGSNNGADPLQIADIAHCFSASIEELYELSPNGAQPYAEIILASPTYTYLDPPALGQALGAINTLMTPATMADQILRTYDSLIEQADLSDGDSEVEHPRLLVAVNSRQVARVKQNWDKVAYALLQNFDGEKLRQAYLASPKYDTTLCRPQDWALSPPDALSDLYGFAVALQQVYGAESAVGQAATTVIWDLEENAILSRYQRNGTPWYAPQNAQFWNFDQHKGIALYTDLQGMPTAKAATVELSWQSRWYTADTLGGENPRPFAFLQQGFNGVTWADVFAEFWRRQPDVTLQTALCFPELASDPQPGELRAHELSAPLANTLRVGLPFTPVAVVDVAQATLKPAVRFNIYDATQTLLYSNTVHGGYWLTGTHQLAANRPYTPTAPGPLTVEIVVDPANAFIETAETDNKLAKHFAVNGAGNLFPLTIAAQLVAAPTFVQQDQIALQSQVNPAHEIARLEAQLYQFVATGDNEPWQPTLRNVQMLDPVQPVLALAGLPPGVVRVHLWARTVAGQYSAAPAVVEFNYAPAGQAISAGERHLYRLPSASRLAQELTLAQGNGTVELFVWSPFNGWAPEWAIGATGATGLTLPAGDTTGDYLIEVTARAADSYTLTAQPSTHPPTGANGSNTVPEHAPFTRPALLSPVVTPPGDGALVPGVPVFLPLIHQAE